MSSRQPLRWWQELAHDLDHGAAFAAHFVHQLCGWRAGFPPYRNPNRTPRSHGRQVRRRRRRMIILEETVEEDAYCLPEGTARMSSQLLLKLC